MHNGRTVWALLLAVFTGCATQGPSQIPPPNPVVDVNAGEWRTWALTSGKELRLQPPPDAAV